MSRIGKQPVALPEKVKAAVNGTKVSIEGPLGKLERTVRAEIAVKLDDAKRQIVLTRTSDEKTVRMLHGLERTLVNNMVIGVVKGYRKDLEIVGVGYNVRVDGNVLAIELGFADPAKFTVPKGIKVEVQQQTNPGKFSISGCDKHDVGQFAALVRSIKPPEPYQGKGIKYADEVIRRKAGKAFVGAGA